MGSVSVICEKNTDVISEAEKQEVSKLWEALDADIKEGRPARRSRPRP